MIAGLAAWLHDSEPAGTPELVAALERLLSAPGARVACEGGEVLRPGKVQRLCFATEGDGPRSLVVKRLSPGHALCEQRALRVWLPAVGLGACAASLLAVAAAPGGEHVWHVYEDLGDETLERLAAHGPLRTERIRAALEPIAALHLRCVAQPLLADGRLAGSELGAGFFAAASRDAVHALAALRRLPNLPPEHRPLLDRLLERLTSLAAEGRARAQALAELGWPETLQHGDLWLSNILLPTADPEPRLIDWERAGVGIALYDLSTLLRQLPPGDRPWVLDAYRVLVQPAGWPWPELAGLEYAAESCELGRFASCLAWRVFSTLELPRDVAAPPAWLYDDLVEMERWFAERTPLLPRHREVNAA